MHQNGHSAFHIISLMNIKQAGFICKQKITNARIKQVYNMTNISLRLYGRYLSFGILSHTADLLRKSQGDFTLAEGQMVFPQFSYSSAVSVYHP